MPECEIKLKGFECSRCGHKWVQNNSKNEKKDKPIVCPNPKCHSPYWDIPKKNKENKK